MLAASQLLPPCDGACERPAGAGRLPAGGAGRIAAVQRRAPLRLLGASPLSAALNYIRTGQTPTLLEVP